jgi:hypothetical protein
MVPLYIVCIIPPSSPFRSLVPFKGGLLGDVADTPQFWGSFDQCSWFEVPFHLGMVGINGLSCTHARHFPHHHHHHHHYHHITTPPRHHLDNQLNTITQPPLKPIIQQNNTTIPPTTTLTLTPTQIHLITPTSNTLTTTMADKWTPKGFFPRIFMYIARLVNIAGVIALMILIVTEFIILVNNYQSYVARYGYHYRMSPPSSFLFHLCSLFLFLYSVLQGDISLRRNTDQ